MRDLDHLVTLQTGWQFIFVSSAITLLLISMPVRSLMGEWYCHAALNMIDDPKTEYHDRLDLTDETIDLYRQALESMDKALVWQGENWEYLKIKLSLYMHIEKWAQVLRSLGNNIMFITLHPSAIDEVYIAALKNHIIDSDLRLMSAERWADRGDRELATRELERTAMLYPLDVTVRYAVAYRYLLIEINHLAMEHARALAKLDDSFIIRDVMLKKQMREDYPAVYISFLKNSYLMRSLEIVWRASGENREVVDKIVPNGDDAQDVLALFKDSKGIL